MGATVAFLAPGASTPKLVHMAVRPLATLTWTEDGPSVVAIGSVGPSDVGMFRITPDGFARIPLGGVSFRGGKWVDVPVAIVGQRIVFNAYPKASAQHEAIISVMADGSGLMLLNDDTFPVERLVTFAPAPDGRHVAVSSNGIWVFDVTDGSRRRVRTGDGGIMDWQPVP